MADVELTVDLQTVDAEGKAKQLQERIETIFDNLGKFGNQVPAKFMPLQKQLVDAYYKANKLRAELESGPQETQEYKDTVETFQKLQTEIEKAESKIKRYERALETIKEKEAAGIPVTDKTKFMMELEDQRSALEKLKQELSEVQEKKEKLETSGEFQIDKSGQAEQDLLSLNNQMATLIRRTEDMVKIPISTEKWTPLYLTGVGIATVMKKAGTIIKSALINGLQLAANAAKNLAKRIASISWNTLKSAANAAKNLASNLAQAVGSKIKNGLGSLTSSMLGLKKNTDDTNKSVKQGIKLFIKYAFGVRSFFFLYRRIRKSIVEGFENLAQYSGPLNNKISQILTSFETLKNAITAAFAPIVNYVAPIVTLFIDKITAATTAVSQFFAALLGQTTFVRAKKAYHDYAKDLQQSQTQAQEKEEAARKKHEESEQKRYEKYLKQKEKKEKKYEERMLKLKKKYERQLAGFDDVEILKEAEKEEMEEMDPFESNPYTSSATASANQVNPWEDFNNMFETVKVEAKFKKLADMIKGFFKNQDWNGLGKFLGNGINKAFEVADKLITSKTLQKKIDTVINAIVGTLNSLVTTVKWDLIGKTIGDFVNLVLHTINRLLTEINWYNIGKAIATGLNSMITTIHWDEVGQYFANKFNAVLNTLWGFVSNFNWANLGIAIGTAIKNMFLSIDWATLAITLSGLVNGVFESIRTLNETIPWNEIGGKIGNSFNLMVTTINWGEIGTTASNFINNIFHALYDLVTTIDWVTLAEDLGTMINNFVLGIDWELVFTTAGELIGSIFDALYTLATTIRWQDIIDTLSTAFHNFVENLHWNETKDSIGKKWGDIWDILESVLSSIDWNELSDTVGTFVSDMIEDVPWETIGELIGKFFKFALDFLGKILAKVDWAGIGESIGTFLGEVDWFGIFSKLMDFIGGLIGGFIEALPSTLWKFIKTATSNLADSLKDKSAPEIVAGFLQGIAKLLASPVTWIVEHVATPFLRGVAKAFGIASPAKKMQPLGENVAKGFLTGITNGLKSIGSWIKTNVFDKVHGSLKTAFGIAGSVANKVKDIGASIIGGIKDGTTNNYSKLKSALDKTTQNIYNDLKNGRGAKWTNIGSSIIEGIESGLKSGWRWLSSTVSDLANDLFNSAKRTLGINSPSKLFKEVVGRAIPEGIGVGIEKYADYASNAVDGLTDSLTDNPIQLPPIVAGRIIPYSVDKNDNSDISNTLTKLVDMLQYNQSNGITLSDLESVLTTMFRSYMNIQFYLSDEQIARHANAGNERLDRRFNPSIK